MFKGLKYVLQSQWQGWLGVYLLLKVRAEQTVVWCVFCPATFPSPVFLQQHQWEQILAQGLERCCSHSCGLLYMFTISLPALSSPLYSHLVEQWEKEQKELEENSSKSGCDLGQILATIHTG